ncbi:MAG: hypothetical protein ACFB0C_23890 [Leptolyngbyaceae cyanobacterium]
MATVVTEPVGIVTSTPRYTVSSKTQSQSLQVSVTFSRNLHGLSFVNQISRHF